MANFAFIYTPSDGWIGGKNYYLGLFRQLNSDIDPLEDSVYIFTNNSCNISELQEFDKFSIVQTRLLSRKKLCMLLYKIAGRVLGDNAILYFLLKRYNIDVLSHSYIPSWLGIRSLPWIPDFQHCILPDHFSKSEIRNRNSKFQKVLKNENFLLSSYSSLEDAKKFFTINGAAKVYRFLPTPIINFDYNGFDQLCLKLNISKSFVFLPNQFWKHKNHMLCFKACLQAKLEGKGFTVVCSGGLLDYRHPEYIEEIESFIKEHDLSSEIILLGLVDRAIFNCFLANAAVVINPSKFEGWSTTVEEGKALNKRLALSNINVHEEQAGNVNGVMYFGINDLEQCKFSIQSLLVSNITPTFNPSSDNIYSILKSIV
jgi:glycosyltransferase involved in cell wall biosynthesis